MARRAREGLVGKPETIKYIVYHSRAGVGGFFIPKKSTFFCAGEGFSFVCLWAVRSKEDIVEINRREFIIVLFVVADAGCGGQSSPTSPTYPQSDTSSLLSRVQALGHSSAQRVQFENTKAAQIAIRGDINWNFLIGDNALAIGPPVKTPTLDASAIPVPDNAELQVRSF